VFVIFGYGGNALLGKKCHALRIASWQARTEGLARRAHADRRHGEPAREVHYVLGAFPVGLRQDQPRHAHPPTPCRAGRCGPSARTSPGCNVGADGRLRAINPEAGFFGVVPGTSPKTNRNAYEMIHHDTIYTNVAVTADNEPWWEGRITGTPVTDWQAARTTRRTARRHTPTRASRWSAKQNRPTTT